MIERNLFFEKVVANLEGEEVGIMPAANTSKFANYAFRKSLAAGFLDVALLMANVSQLKILLNSTELKAQAIVVIVLVAISMAMQLVVGIMLIYVGYYEQDDSIEAPEPERDVAHLVPPTTSEAANENFENLKKAGRIHDRLTNMVTIGIFIILFINIIISGMGLGLPTGEDAKYNIDHLGLNTTKGS